MDSARGQRPACSMNSRRIGNSLRYWIFAGGRAHEPLASLSALEKAAPSAELLYRATIHEILDSRWEVRSSEISSRCQIASRGAFRASAGNFGLHGFRSPTSILARRFAELRLAAIQQRFGPDPASAQSRFSRGLHCRKGRTRGPRGGQDCDKVLSNPGRWHHVRYRLSFAAGVPHRTNATQPQAQRSFAPPRPRAILAP